LLIVLHVALLHFSVVSRSYPLSCFLADLCIRRFHGSAARLVNLDFFNSLIPAKKAPHPSPGQRPCLMGWLDRF
jgi:hypothetical protein